MAFTRSELPGPGESHVQGLFAESRPPENYLFARTYRVDSNGVAVMAISEWFLPDLGPHLGPR